MLKCRKRQIKNLKEDIIEKRPNDRASCAAEKVGAWDTILLIHTFGVTVLYTVAPFFKEYLFAQVAAKKVIITYIVLALVCIGFAVWAYIRKSNYIIIQNEFIDAERKAELEKARNKEYENELSEQLSSFASIVSDIFVEQHNGNNSAATYAQIIANHLFLECQRRFGKVKLSI